MYYEYIITFKIIMSDFKNKLGITNFMEKFTDHTGTSSIGILFY